MFEMAVNSVFSESDDGEVISDLGEDLEDELSNSPHILKLIHKMRDRIKRQCKKIHKLRNKLNEQRNKNLCEKLFIDYGTQTDPLQHENETSLSQNWDISNNTEAHSITEQVKEAAESALLQTGFVYEETSGLYYDYKTGYYYDGKQGLYYDGHSGTYYYYDENSKTYQFHSQIPVDTNEVHPTVASKEKRKSIKANKVSDEIHELISGISNVSIERYKRQAIDLAKVYPPCMRIIIKETNLAKLKMGMLFLVAYTGGTIGREGDHSVLIPDINISKHHARFAYSENKKCYELVDLGSRNGTLLNGKRLSVAKQESEPHEVTHGSIVQVGETKLLCHIHSGNETCGHCEPGLVQKNCAAEENRAPKQESHKQELRRLKYKFGVEKGNIASASQVAVGYQDRAQARRQCVGSSNHHAKTEQSSVNTSITKDNRGFKLLSKMGWTEGRSLGKDGGGRTEPISFAGNPNKSGFGSTELEFPSIELDSNMEKKQAVWRKTQQRYKEISE